MSAFGGGGDGDLTCSCLEHDFGRCNNSKTCAFILNFVANKIKLFRVDRVPANFRLVNIKDYLRSIKSMLLLIFVIDIKKYTVL